MTLDPPLKWAGGKRWLLPTLRDLYERHRHRRLVEPFGGGLAVTLGLDPDRGLVGDSNFHLVNFYLRLSDPKPFEIEMRADRGFYYAARERFNQIARVAGNRRDRQEAAELFYYLNRTGFNGLCRFSRQGRFNVPFGSRTEIDYRRDFSQYAVFLSKIDLFCGDFEDLVIDSDDFLYLDPPYDSDGNGFVNYSKDGFFWQDQLRLAHFAARHPGPVVISNAATDKIVKLYSDLGFHLVRVSAPRRIASNGNRADACEILATKKLDWPTTTA